MLQLTKRFNFEVEMQYKAGTNCDNSEERWGTRLKSIFNF